MKFPIAMAAGMAGYIFKNKMRPRPEWQKNVAAGAGRVQPVPYPARQDRREARSRIR